MERSNHNGTLSLKDVNKEVTLVGWVHKKRNLGSLLFIDLRDRSGIVQVTVREGTKVPDVRNEYVIWVKGKVAKKDVPNKQLKTGEIEVIASEIKIINKAETPPIIIDDNTDALEDTRLKYRYLDLRNSEVHNNILFRSEVIDFIRQIANLSERQFSYLNPNLDVSVSKYRINAVHPSIGRINNEKVCTFAIRIGSQESRVINDLDFK